MTIIAIKNSIIAADGAVFCQHVIDAVNVRKISRSSDGALGACAGPSGVCLYFRNLFLNSTAQHRTLGNVFVADLKTIKTGWFHFAEGKSPSITMDISLTEKAPQPSADHKRGFRMNLYSPANFGGVVEFQANSGLICGAVDALHTAYEAAPESKTGQLPVVKLTGFEPVKGNFGINFKPLFQILKWIPRPAALDETVTPVAAPAAAAAQNNAPAAPAQAVAGVSEF